PTKAYGSSSLRLATSREPSERPAAPAARSGAVSGRAKNLATSRFARLPRRFRVDRYQRLESVLTHGYTGTIGIGFRVPGSIFPILEGSDESRRRCLRLQSNPRQGIDRTAAHKDILVFEGIDQSWYRFFRLLSDSSQQAEGV